MHNEIAKGPLGRKRKTCLLRIVPPPPPRGHPLPHTTHSLLLPPFPHTPTATAAAMPLGKRKMRRHVQGLPIRCLDEEDYDKMKKTK